MPDRPREGAVVVVLAADLEVEAWDRLADAAEAAELDVAVVGELDGSLRRREVA